MLPANRRTSPSASWGSIAAPGDRRGVALHMHQKAIKRI